MQICLMKFWTWLIFVPNFYLFNFDMTAVHHYCSFLTLQKQVWARNTQVSSVHRLFIQLYPLILHLSIIKIG